MIDPFAFAKTFLFLRGKPYDFTGRAYLEPIYNFRGDRLVLRTGRQCEKTATLVNLLIYFAATIPGVRILVVLPRDEQLRVLSTTRFRPTLEGSPLIRKYLWGRGANIRVRECHFRNGSIIFLRSVYHSADPARGIDADILLADEFQDLAAGELPVLMEALSHSAIRKVILTGTPKTMDNQLQTEFSRTTMNEWRVPCPKCGRDAALDESCLGPDAVRCPKCETPLDVRTGRWVPRNPGAAGGEGFWMNALIGPWMSYKTILDHKIEYDPVQFETEVLGVPVVLGDHLVSLAEAEACCADRTMANGIGDIPVTHHRCLCAGVDWGGGSRSRTVVVVGGMDCHGVFQVWHFLALPATEDPKAVVDKVAAVCRTFRVGGIAADGGGNGHVYNTQLSDKLERRVPVTGILYMPNDHRPELGRHGVREWNVSRSGTLADVFRRIREKGVRFPRAADSLPFLEEIACEVASYDEAQRTIKYECPPGQRDDTLHALAYCLRLSAYQASGGSLLM